MLHKSEAAGEFSVFFLSFCPVEVLPVNLLMCSCLVFSDFVHSHVLCLY